MGKFWQYYFWAWTLAVLLAPATYAQANLCVDTEHACNKQGIYVIADQEPLYKGGVEGLVTSLNEVVHLPKRSRGVLALKFSINCEGEVYGFEILEGINIATDEAIINALANLQHWEPAVHRGQPVDFSERVAIRVGGGKVKRVEL